MTSKSTSKKGVDYEDTDDTHDKILKEFWRYSYWQERFERYGYKGSSVEAKHCLTRLKRLLVQRQREINIKAKELHGDQNDNQD